MTPEQWRVVTEIFHGALAQAAAERPKYLDAVCHDASLRAEVEALLLMHGEVGGLDKAAGFDPSPKQLLPGTQLGPYRIESLIGAGGMGEVYRAKDTRLDRSVAVKVLPSHLRFSTDVQARFEREARTISRLTHPHICTLYDIGHENGIEYLVMELLEGESLASRLSRGAMPLDQVLRVGVEIAAALDHAHRHAVMHRDLKPGNVMLTRSGAKLLDFGLAKLRRRAGVPAASATTIEAAETTEGTLLGTLPYMAPEQLEGHEADARSDIWAFGCLLYELTTGRRAFEGSSRTALMAAILEHHPEQLSRIQPLTPPALERVVTACLAKDPDERWQSAADLRRELQWISDGARSGPESRDSAQAVRSSSARQNRAAILIAAAALVLTAGALILWLTTGKVARPSSPNVTRSTISLAAAGLTLVPGGLAISADGQTLVFAAQGTGDQRLYVRRMNDYEVRPLAGTERGTGPILSPDGEWVAFTVNTKGLLKVPLRGGPSQPISTFNSARGGVWTGDGWIVIGSAMVTGGSGLWKLRADGGTPQPIVRGVGSTDWYLTPDLLPNGKMLFTLMRRSEGSIAIADPQTGQVRPIIQSARSPRYVPTGHLLYVAGGHLNAIGFDAERFETRGPARVVVDNVGDTRGVGLYAVSANGTLAYAPGVVNLKNLVWIDRSGTSTPMKIEARGYSEPAISPDGRLVAVTVYDQPARNVWIGSTSGGPLTQITFGNDDVFSLFTPDSKRVLFTSGQDGKYNIFSTPADGSGSLERLTDSTHPQKPTSISKSDVLLFNDIDADTKLDVLELDLKSPGSAQPRIHTIAKELNAEFSPDGRWVAYSSDKTGQFEVWVEAYPGPGMTRQVSVGGGVSPQWNPRGGGELLYQGPDAVMSVRISGDLAIGPASKVFQHAQNVGPDRDWTITPDGSKFLVVERLQVSGPYQINVISNWFEELKALVPVR